MQKKTRIKKKTKKKAQSQLNFYSSYLAFCFRMVSFRGQIRLEPRPDWSYFGV